MKQRVITGVLGGAGFIGLLYLGKLWFAALIVLLAIIGFHEYLRMFQIRPYESSAVIGFISIIYFVIPWGELTARGVPDFATSMWLLMLLLFSLMVFTKNKTSIEKAALIFLGSVYISVGFYYMIYTRWMEHGLYWTLLLFVCIWITDSGAYFTGWAIGKRLLWPAISPKKTVEGAIGGIVFSIAAAICFSLYDPALLEISRAVGIGIVIALVGQLGDLIQSAYKRARGIKDTGTLLPGHGGVLDRCDSWLIVFPFIQLLSLLS